MLSRSVPVTIGTSVPAGVSSTGTGGGTGPAGISSVTTGVASHASECIGYFATLGSGKMGAS